MEAILTIALVVSNFFWVIYNDRRDKRDIQERREILNRKAEPSMVIPPDNIVKAKIKNAEKIAKLPIDEDMSPVERHEFAAVGQVDPKLMRTDGKND